MGLPRTAELLYHAVSDAGLDQEMLAARRKREADSLRRQLVDVQPRLRTLRELHDWLHVEHKCYAVARQAEWLELSPASSMGDKALASY